MAYKIHNPYKESQIMELNLMGVEEFRKFRVRPAEILLTLAPLAIAGLVAAIAFMPEISFLAECINVGQGDVCHIAMQ